MMQNAVGDFPTFVDGGHAHSVYWMGNMTEPTHTFIGATGATNTTSATGGGLASLYQQDTLRNTFTRQSTPQDKPKVNQMARRIVQVFIADPDENVPLEKSVIYTGQQKLTDLTDQELYFEINLKEILDKHNEYRKTLIDKKVKERTENLEPAKIRDLKMVVVTIASF